ncbi:electron transport complex subunit RsxC [Marinicella rhabdoformis]|uniref:electron transport complex subunit RsxC n=1 Tax=Marinicella rhabdoformis TaxID=2580566 RepID=UPI0012AEBA24|nr:electron transport complex subunit RsxC [Marinicella rhabdoformis]
MGDIHLAQFHGGLVLDHHKTQVNQQTIKTAPIPQRLLISLRVNRGFEAVPVVIVGDYVFKGQCIAKAEYAMASDVHASSSGTVVSIQQRPSSAPDAALATVIEIETDGKDQWCDLTPLYPAEITAHNIQKVMKPAGILGMGGAGFPTHLKYKTGQRAVETLVINGAECEPYIACDERLMLEQAIEVVKGSALMMQAADAFQTIIAIEDSLGGVQSALEAAINELNIEHFSVIKVPSIYPTGGEKQLIEVLTGKQVPAGETPLALGVLMQNVATAKALHDAVYMGQPLIERVITVTGEQVAKPCNYLARIGTPMRDLLTDAGAQEIQQSRLVVGGPMMGFAMPDDDIGIDKTSNCLLLMKAENQVLPDLGMPNNDMPCIRCGDCVKVCPQDLLPQQLFWYINGNEDGNDLEKARDHNLFDCIECGACAYVCPSQIDLVDFYRYGKAELRYLDFKKTKAEQAKERFEAREARLIRLKQERQAKRRAKTSQLKDKKVAKKEISDVLARIKQMKDKKEEGQSDE